MKHLKNVTKVLDQLGLEMSDKTGGMLDPDAKGVVRTDQYGGEPVVVFQDRPEILLLSGKQFLKSLKETENSFNIQLFVNG